MKKAILSAELASNLSDKSGVQVFDVRLAEDREPVNHEVPGASWRDPKDIDAWADDVDPNRPVVVFCVHGLRVSQGVRNVLEEKGFDASILEGGIDAWQEYAGNSTAAVR